MNRTQAHLLGVLLVCPGLAVAANLDTLTEDCNGCHGPQGVSTHGDVPTIAGQSADFIAGSLRAFQELGRPCQSSAYRHGDTARPATTMCRIAAALDEENIAALGEYYGGLDFVPAAQHFDPALAAAGEQLYVQNCESCHPEGGRVAERGPILAGQWTPYLQRAMREAATGEHLVPPIMEREVVRFSDDEIDALLNFLASRPHPD
jgi:cytochrome c553